MKNKNNQAGFTIIELLIATSIVSVILLIVSATLVNLGSLFNKGVSQSNVQDTVRNLTDQIVSELQVDGSSVQMKQVISPLSPLLNEWVYCIGENRYTFVYDVAPSDPSSPIIHALWYDTVPACNPNKPANLGAATPSSKGQDLLAPDARITSFCIGNSYTNTNSCSNSDLTEPYNVSIGVIEGSSSLLCNKSMTTTTDSTYCNNPSSTNSLTEIQQAPPTAVLGCKGFSGQQFCAPSFLETTVSSKL